MAKSDQPGFVDKHIEKVILGVCLLVMVVCVVRYGLSTPLRLEGPGNESLPPSQVDEALLENAESVRNRVANATKERPEVPDWTDKLVEAQRDPLKGTPLLALNYGVPNREGMDMPTLKNPDRADLEALAKVMPAPFKPLSWAGVELTLVNDEAIKEDPVLHGLSIYPWEELENAWNEELSNSVILPIMTALRIEVEFQVRKPDGTWEAVPDVAPVRMQPADFDEPLEVPTIPEYTGDNALTVQQAVMDYEKSGWAEYMLRPQWYPVWTDSNEATNWQVHAPIEEIRELLNIEDVLPEPLPMEQETEISDVDAFDSARPPRPAVPDGGSYPSPSYRRPPSNSRTTMNRIDRDELQEDTLLPDIMLQRKTGVRLGWFHSDALKYGKTYRYRMRFVFVNPLLTQPEKHLLEDHPEYASVPTVDSPWSDWSDPVSIQREVEFFVTGANPLREEITVTVFTKVLGQRVSETFGQIVPGQRIGGKKTVTVRNPLSMGRGDEEITRVVEFETGAIAVQFDFAKQYRSSSGTIRRDGVELVYLDESGTLASRLKYNDRRSPRLNELREEIRQAERDSRFDGEYDDDYPRRRGMEDRSPLRPSDPPRPSRDGRSPDSGQSRPSRRPRR